MSNEITQKQEKLLAQFLKGKEILKPLNTGWVDSHVCCIREYGVNLYFYTRGGRTIMIDAGYNYDRLEEKMSWLDLKPEDIQDILLTHVDGDHVGALEKDSPQLFSHARVYLGAVENRYLTGEKRRKIFKKYTLPQVSIGNPVTLLEDEQVFRIGDIQIEALLVRGHTWGHMVYLIDNSYLFAGDAIWLGPDGGYSFVNVLAEDSHLAKCSLKVLKYRLDDRKVQPKILTAHSGWTDDLDFAFAHSQEACNGFRRQKPHDPRAPENVLDESGDTEQAARTQKLPKQMRL